MKSIIKLFSLMFLLSTFSFSVFAVEPIYQDFFGKAIKGYDPVSYFKDSKAVKGDSDIQYKWNNAVWYFSTEENKKDFILSPEKYAPQYGGYCAWAVSQGYTAKIDPKAWTVHNGKLYLNYNKSVRKSWLGDINGNIKKGNENWINLISE